ALADDFHVHARRQLDVRNDAAVLRAFARDAVVLADRQRELTRHADALEGEQVLHRALTEGRLADHDAALVVLDRSPEDFGGALAVAIHEYRERPRVRGRVRRIGQNVDRAARLLELDDRAAVDAQAAELGGLREVTAAVLAQVDDEAVDTAFGVELVEQAQDILRRARVVGGALALRREILVEARHGDDADAERARLGRHLDEVLLRGLLLELHLVARQDDDLLGRPRRDAFRQHLQAHLRA